MGVGTVLPVREPGRGARTPSGSFLWKRHSLETLPESAEHTTSGHQSGGYSVVKLKVL